MRGLRALLRQKRSSRAAHEAAPPEAAHQVKRAGEYRQTKREREISSLLPVRSRLPVLDARCVVFAIQASRRGAFRNCQLENIERVQKRVEIIRKKVKTISQILL